MNRNMDYSSLDASKIWDTALQRLRRRSESLYVQWFSRIVPLEVSGDRLKLGVPDDFFRDMVEENYGDLMLDSLKSVGGVAYTFILEEGHFLPEAPAAVQLEPLSDSSLPPASSAPVPPPQTTPHRRNLRDYSFDNFVVGHANRQAFAAAKAVAEDPGMVYNPLFIYGTNGIGKTHLLQAIASEVHRSAPQLIVRSVTCDEILNDYYDLLINKRSFSDFRASLRDVDLLLIDDIHRLEKKKAMQEEFFNIFNILYQQNKQIVLTSDRQPCEINDLDKRLSSRFEQGMTCQINMPEYEERLAILRMWRDGSLTKPQLPDRLLDFLASNISSNVRRLKGCFLRLSAYVEMSGSDDLSIEEVEELLHAQLSEENAARDIRPESIQQLVARHFNLSVADLIGARRTRQVAEPRMIAMYLCRDLTRLSSNEIGSAFGRTHANVLHAAKSITDRCADDEEMRRTVSLLKRQLQKH